MNINALTWDDLKIELENTIKRKLRLAPNTKIDVKLSRAASKPGTGEISIQFSGLTACTPTIEPTAVKSLTVAQNDDEAFLLSALRDAYEKNSRPFLSLKWFKTKWLPAIGARFTEDELNTLITRLIASEAILIERVDNPYGHPVTTIRTPDMPVPRSSDEA